MIKLKKLICLIFAVIITASIFEFNVSAAKIIVDAPKSLSVYDDISTAYLSWSKVSGSSGYVVARSTTGKKWKRIATLKGESNRKFTNTGLISGQAYYYRVKAYKTVNKKKKFSKPSPVKNVTGGMDFYIATYSNSVELCWQRIKSAKGYIVYCSVNDGDFKRLKVLTNNNLTSYTATKIDTKKNKYAFYVACYKSSGSKKNCYFQTFTKYSNTIESVINGSVSNSKYSLPLVNVQSKKSKNGGSIAISKSDRKIFSDYANNNFNQNFSPNDMIKSVFNFIHDEVNYARGDLYSKISSCTSYADAIFNNKIGQCAEYNGAMAQYLAYLGFETRLIQGYRGTSNKNRWQHFWCEVDIGDNTYVVETGNEGEDGSWHYYFTPYSKTKKYIKCNKYVSGIK